MRQERCRSVAGNIQLQPGQPTPDPLGGSAGPHSQVCQERSDISDVVAGQVVPSVGCLQERQILQQAMTIR